jgi:hypothetical protein
MMFNPFRYRYWLCESVTQEELRIIRSRRNPVTTGQWNGTLTDGPFDSQEDATHALHFWFIQLWGDDEDEPSDSDINDADWWKET